MKNYKKIIATLTTAIITIGSFANTTFAEDIMQNETTTLQDECPSSYSIYIPDVIDITYGNCLSLSEMNLADDKQVFVRVSGFNDNGTITLTHTGNSSKTIEVTLVGSNGTLSADNNLLCTFDNSSMGSSMFEGQCEDSSAQAGKYRGTVTFNIGLRDKQ